MLMHKLILFRVFLFCFVVFIIFFLHSYWDRIISNYVVSRFIKKKEEKKEYMSMKFRST